jgi:hypothetical protein
MVLRLRVPRSKLETKTKTDFHLPFKTPAWRIPMSNHLPPVPPANQSHKGPGSDLKPEQDNSKKHPGLQNAAEQGETANIKQNTTNKGFFHGRRVK